MSSRPTDRAANGLEIAFQSMLLSKRASLSEERRVRALIAQRIAVRTASETAARPLDRLTPAEAPGKRARASHDDSDSEKEEDAMEVGEIQIEKAPDRNPKMDIPSREAYHPIVEWSHAIEYQTWLEEYKSKVKDGGPILYERMMPPSGRNWFILKTDFFEENSPAYNYCKNKEEFIRTDKLVTSETNSYNFAVQADDPNGKGFFNPEALDHFYTQMIRDGKVMFSVVEGTPSQPGLSVQFFPDNYVCSNAGWWTSKVTYLPNTIKVLALQGGTFNQIRKFDPQSGFDPRTWLPELPRAYGIATDKAGVEDLLARSKQNGIVVRFATCKQEEAIYGMPRPVREFMIAGFASARGIGPRIFAAWITPVDGYPFTPKMEKGGIHEHFMDGLTTPNYTEYDASFYKQDNEFDNMYWPKYPWWSKEWGHTLNTDSKLTNRSSDNTTEVYPIRPSETYAEVALRKEKWHRRTMVMEAFEGNLDDITFNTTGEAVDVEQVEHFTKAIWEQCQRMGESGMLHCDLKGPNMVFRTYRDDGKMVSSQSPWNKCEVRTIDFDPYFVKICPFIPSEIITLINAACIFAMLKCWDKANITTLAKDIIGRQFTELVATVNKKYGKDEAPFAAAFRATSGLLVTAHQGPLEMMNVKNETVTNPHYNKRLSFIFNNEFEAARAFRQFVQDYLETKCATMYKNSDAGGKVGGVPTLARLLAFVRDGNQNKANEFVPNVEDPSHIVFPPL